MATLPPIPEELWNQLPPAAQAAVLAVTATLEARIAELEARLNLNSSNSSRPPSSDPPSAKPAPPQTPSGRRKGAQPGHTRHPRPQLPPDTTAELKADTCRHCHTPLAGDDPDPIRHQVIEIPPVRPHVTEYRRHRITCPRCRRVNCAPLPAGVRGGYGPRLQAVCSLLAGAYRIGKRGVARLCGELFGVPISPGAVCRLQHQTTDALRPVAQQIQAHVADKPANVDETGWREGSKRAWLWTAVTRFVSAFVVRPSRGRKVLPELIPGNPGVLTTDRFPVYDHLLGQSRQVCWAHLRRDFQAMVDRKDAGSVIGGKLLACADRLLSNWKRVRDGTLPREGFRSEHLDAIAAEVRTLLSSGSACGCARTSSVCRELQRVEGSLWTFGAVPGVEPTNNAAERALRHAVCWRKTSYGTDSEKGSRFVERILSVIESCRQQGRHLLTFLSNAILSHRTNSPAPSLIPAGA